MGNDKHITLVFKKYLAGAKRFIDRIMKTKTPYADLIYDTLMPRDACMQTLLDIAISGEFKLSSLFFTQVSDTKLDMVLREWPLGGRAVRRTRAVAEFFEIEDGRTVIQVVFQDECHPFQSVFHETGVLDQLFETTLGAYRRKR